MSKVTIKRDNTIAARRPDLLEEWDWEKNKEIGLDPYTNATCGMDRKAYWHCLNHPHDYSMNIDTRVKSTRGCPYCSGRRVLTGFNDLATTDPLLANEWMRAENDGVTPQNVSRGSHEVVTWRCSKHEVVWKAKICDRSQGEGCAVCKGEKISAARSRVRPGNSLAERYPEVASQWDAELNGKSPYQVSAHAKEKAHWICLNHEEPYRWMAEIHTRTGKQKAGCPLCGTQATSLANSMPVPGESLGDLFPEVDKEWAYDMNGDLTPWDVRSGSNKRVTWRCSFCGETWSSIIANRTQGGKFKRGCKACSNSRMNPLKLRPKTCGYLKDKRPDLAKEWDHAKNKELLNLTLDHVSTNSSLWVWWICPKGHSYLSSVNHRAGRGDGCNVCSSKTHVSYPEKAIYYYVSKVFSDAEENYHPRFDEFGGMELDIWLPSIKTAIEYDGHFWHVDIEHDKRKDDICYGNGVRIIRIREHGCATYDSTATFIERETVYDAWSLDNAIRDLLHLIAPESTVDIDTKRDEPYIRALIGNPSNAAFIVQTGEQLKLNIAC